MTNTPRRPRYRAIITEHHDGAMAPLVFDACEHAHLDRGAAAKCAAVKVRATLNGPSDSLPVECGYIVKPVG